MLTTFSILCGLWLGIINLTMIDEKRNSTIAMMAVTVIITVFAIATKQTYVLLAGYVLTLVHTFKDWTKWGIVGICATITIPIIFHHTTWILIIAIAIMVSPILIGILFIMMLLASITWMMLTQ